MGDTDSRYIPVWRSQNLDIELDGAERRAAILTGGTAAIATGGFDDVEETLARGELVFLGLIDERAHFALDVSPFDAPLDMLRSPALASMGVEAAPDSGGVRFADLRQLAGRLDRHEGALLALARAMLFWHSRHRFCGVCGNRRSEEAGHAAVPTALTVYALPAPTRR